MKEPHQDWSLIVDLGGPAKAAALLGTTIQRVHNWKERGIPSKVKVKHPELFLPALQRRKKSPIPA
jgi:hypothetical protein